MTILAKGKKNVGIPWSSTMQNCTTIQSHSKEPIFPEQPEMSILPSSSCSSASSPQPSVPTVSMSMSAASAPPFPTVGRNRRSWLKSVNSEIRPPLQPRCILTEGDANALSTYCFCLLFVFVVSMLCLLAGQHRFHRTKEQKRDENNWTACYQKLPLK